MGFFSDIQEEARREARQSRYQTGQTEDAAPVQNIQSKGERKPETTQPAPTPMPEPKQPAPAVTPMDDGEVMAASVKRIRADIERITRRNMKDCVAKYLADLCAKDPRLCPHRHAAGKNHGELLPLYQPKGPGIR